MGTWRTLEHTADLALEASGTTAAEAVETLCLGLMSQVSDPHRIRSAREVSLVGEGADRAEALVTLLGELLYWINTKGWVFARFRAQETGPTRIRLQAWGEPRDPARHPFDLEVKAATYHQLHFTPHGRGWRVRVIFDV